MNFHEFRLTVYDDTLGLTSTKTHPAHTFSALNWPEIGGFRFDTLGQLILAKANSDQPTHVTFDFLEPDSGDFSCNQWQLTENQPQKLINSASLMQWQAHLLTPRGFIALSSIEKPTFQVEL